MGVITIEVPQEIRETYQIDSQTKAKKIIDSLGRLGTKKKLRDLSDVVGLWEDRTESAEEIARELRMKSNDRNKKRHDEKLDSALDAVLGIWSYRKESTEEIAKKLRGGWNRKNGNKSG